MEADTGLPLNALKADGGASRDQLPHAVPGGHHATVTVRRPAIRETTALGAAYLAGLATGVWSGLDEIRHLWMLRHHLCARIWTAERRERLLAGWHKAVGRSRDWAK